MNGVTKTDGLSSPGERLTRERSGSIYRQAHSPIASCLGFPAMALAAPPAAPVDTLMPGSTRRRVWQTPAVRSHSLLALTLTKLYLAPAGPPPKPEAVTAIQEGANLDDAFGPLAVAVDLMSVKRLKLDLTTNSLTIEYDPTRGRAMGGSGVGRTPRAEAVITFADHATADDVYSKMWRRLGERFELKKHGVATDGTARRPVALMAGVLAMTAVTALMSVVISNLSDPPWLLAPFAALDWRFVCGLGGAALAGLQVWLYRRLSSPPTALELVARS